MPAKKAASRFICVGYILKPHALKGEVKANFQYPFTGKKIKTLYIGNDPPLPCFVEQIHPMGDIYLLKTSDCNDRNQSEQLAGKKIYVPAKDFEKYFKEDEAATLIGWKAVADGKEIGTIEDVFVLPQQHLAQVIMDGREVLIPLNDETIVKEDKRRKTIFLKLPDGLLDIQ